MRAAPAGAGDGGDAVLDAQPAAPTTSRAITVRENAEATRSRVLARMASNPANLAILTPAGSTASAARRAARSRGYRGSALPDVWTHPAAAAAVTCRGRTSPSRTS